MRYKVLKLIFLFIFLIINVPPALSLDPCLSKEEIIKYFPTIPELEAMGVSRIKVVEDIKNGSCPGAKMSYRGIFRGAAKVYIDVMIHVVRGLSIKVPSYSVFKFNLPRPSKNCQLRGNEMYYTIKCPTDRRETITPSNPNGMTVIVEHESGYTAGKILGGHPCSENPEYLCSPYGSPVVKVMVNVYSKDEEKSTFDTALILGPPIFKLVLQKVSAILRNSNPETSSEDKNPSSPIPVKLNISVSPTSLVANGKEQKLIFQLSMPDGTPAANKIYRVLYSHEPFKKDGKPVNYLTKPIITYYLKTNSKGRGVLFIPTPKIKKATLNNIKNPDAKFPVQAKFNIFDGADLVGSFTINFQSPFPRIKKFLLPCGMDAENWQIRPSKVFIEDLDSNEFDIEVSGYGKFKIRGGKIYNTLLRVRDFKGKVFEFYLASKKLGLNLNKQPNLWRELLDTNLKVAASVLITYSSGKLLSDVRNAFQKGNKLEKILSVNGKIKSEDVAAVAQNYFGTSDYYNNTLSFIHDKNKNYVKTQDMVVGGVFLASGIYDLVKKASGGLGPAMQMELIKAIYENAKTVYGVYSKYRKIADSYRDIIFIPILVRVTDKEGYSAITIRKCGVRVWKGAE